METQWRVETVQADGTIPDSEIFTSFHDAWAYSRVELVNVGWRMYSKKAAKEHFYEQSPLADQPGILRPNPEPFKAAWRPDNGTIVRISLI